MWWLAESWAESASPTSSTMKLVIINSVAVSFGRRGAKRITWSGARQRARDEHQSEHEQRVDQDRAEDRRLGDHQLTGVQREDDDEELGQVAERRLQQAGRRRPEPLSHLLGRDRHDPRRARERDARDDEREYVPKAARVARDRSQDRHRRDDDQPDPFDT